jgi:hypothetical protein
MMDTETTDVSFERDIRPLFRASDRESMLQTFDLWSYDNVKESADNILMVLEAGSMPCDGPWPADQVTTFRAWVDAGSPP